MASVLGQGRYRSDPRRLAVTPDTAFQSPLASTDYFIDDEGSPLETDSNRLANAVITTGCSATTYCPTKLVTPGQMAT